MDPIADRLSLIAVAVTLVIAGVVEWWYLAALLIPDAILLALSLYYFHGHPDLPVSRIGKIRTALLLVGTPLLVLSKLPVPGAEAYFVAAWIFLGLGLVGHWIAAYNYFWAIIRKGRKLKATSSTSTAAPADGVVRGFAGGAWRVLPGVRRPAPGQCRQGGHRGTGAQQPRHAPAAPQSPLGVRAAAAVRGHGDERRRPGDRRR